MIDMTNLERLPSGNTRLRMQVGKRKINGTFATPQEAATVRDAAKREIADEAMVPVDGQSLLQLGPAFLRRRDGNRSSKADKSRWKNHIVKAPFATIAVSTIIRRDLLDWLDEMKTQETAYDVATQGKREATALSWQTRKHCLNLVRSFFGWCVDRELIKSNPALEMAVEREDGDEDEGYQDSWYLDLEEQDMIRTASHAIAEGDPSVNVHELLLVDFAMGAGLRMNEGWCLHLKDVHLDDAKPHVCVQYGTWDTKNKRYRTPKGRKGEKKTRIVPLFGIALEAARAQAQLLKTSTVKNRYALFFPSPEGGRRTKAPRLFQKLQGSLSVVRLKRGPWWHLLRHTCASSMVAGWWGKRWLLDDVRGVLGHSSVKVTERYAHLIPATVHGVAAEAQAAWQVRCHTVATTPMIVAGNGTNQVTSKPPVAGSNPAGHASTYVTSRGNAVATGVALLERVGAGDAVALREWVDVLCDLISENNALRAERAEAAS